MALCTAVAVRLWIWTRRVFLFAWDSARISVTSKVRSRTGAASSRLSTPVLAIVDEARATIFLKSVVFLPPPSN